jgi:hypothetical protein
MGTIPPRSTVVPLQLATGGTRRRTAAQETVVFVAGKALSRSVLVVMQRSIACTGVPQWWGGFLYRM